MKALNKFQRAGGGFKGEKAALEHLQKLMDDPGIPLAPEQKRQIESFVKGRISEIQGIIRNELGNIATLADEETGRNAGGIPVNIQGLIALRNRAVQVGGDDGNRLAKKIDMMLKINPEVVSYSKLPDNERERIKRQAWDMAQDPASGEYGVARFNALQRADERIRTGMKNDGLTFGASRYGLAIGEMDFSKPETLDAALPTNVNTANRIQAQGGTRVLPLTNDQLGRLGGAINAGNAGQQAIILGKLVNGLGPQYSKDVFHKLAETGNKKEAGFAAAGQIYKYDPMTATVILRGMETASTNKGTAPDEKEAAKEANTFLGQSLSHLPKMRGLIIIAADAVAAEETLKAGEAGGKFNSDIYKAALTRVTGGMVKFNGLETIAPVKGMDNTGFAEMIHELTDRQIDDGSNPGLYGDGKKVKAADFKKGSARFFATNEYGKYRVQFDEFDAYTPDNQPWVIDLRNIALTKPTKQAFPVGPVAPPISEKGSFGPRGSR